MAREKVSNEREVAEAEGTPLQPAANERQRGKEKALKSAVEQAMLEKRRAMAKAMAKKPANGP